MPYSDQTADQIGGILDELANALTAVEARQNELDKPALELVQLVGVDVQDISDTLAAWPASDLFDPAGELAEITAWLAAHRTDPRPSTYAWPPSASSSAPDDGQP